MKYSIIYLPTKLNKLNSLDSSSLINVLAGKHISAFHRKFTEFQKALYTFHIISGELASHSEFSIENY